MAKQKKWESRLRKTFASRLTADQLPLVEHAVLVRQGQHAFAEGSKDCLREAAAAAAAAATAAERAPP